jgi:protein-S-isoprenylcysteine O-methyltransferase Ste14
VFNGHWSGWLPALEVIVCWVVFAVVWLAGAVYNLRRAPATHHRSHPRLVWAVAAVGFVVQRWLIPVRVWHSLTVHEPWLISAGLALLLISTAFTLWGRGALGIMWASSAVVKENHVLRTNGPYAVTRHPIYTGILGMLVGTGMVAGLGRWIPVVILLLVMLWIKLRAEERLLEKTFGDAYRAYRGRVPQLLPMPRPAWFSRSPRRAR